ncbi:hypothetical protein [Anabaena lutea]|uniref:Uncharacterized protein n=1 Tax=Anabaena lutea FACHB-196 TaxID=2692881 RepID=A0ABR8FDE1_9NOST|nr:hypothetical protein [Anabaena lutea]MBD2567653.1 hypothetical protein [Anabaena lutea FACHB-196]
MGIKSQITATAIFMLAIAGCSSGDTPQATNTPSPVPTPQVEAQKPPTNPTFPNPVVPPGAIRSVASSNGGIIQSTNGDLQPGLIPKGRPDPFAEIVKPTVSQIPGDGSTKLEVPKIPRLPTTINNPQQTLTAQNRTPRTQTNPALVKKGNLNPKLTATLPKPKPQVNSPLPKVLPQIVANQPIKPVLPPQPQPEAAKAVLVSGVVLIGRQPQAIIKVPEEKTSRYVQAGQLLGNGVLIKRIEMNRGSNPIVILEQYGIEVGKAVGEKPVNSQPSTTASAGNPISMVTPL